MLEWIKKNKKIIGGICVFIILLAIIIIPIVITEKKKTQGTIDRLNGVSRATITINDEKEPMRIMFEGNKTKEEINNITSVNTINLIDSKITLYKELNYTGEKEEYEHNEKRDSIGVYYKKFDYNNNKFKSLIIEPIPKQ
jgi:hypothetical protein